VKSEILLYCNRPCRFCGHPNFHTGASSLEIALKITRPGKHARFLRCRADWTANWSRQPIRPLERGYEEPVRRSEDRGRKRHVAVDTLGLFCLGDHGGGNARPGRCPAADPEAGDLLWETAGDLGRQRLPCDIGQLIQWVKNPNNPLAPIVEY
jgi:hypothetical protein